MPLTFNQDCKDYVLTTDIDTYAELNAIVADVDLSYNTLIETLTNKTIVSPIITGAQYTPGINSQVGTTYETVDGDAGKVIVLDNGSPITLTIHDTAGPGFNALVIQKGAGQVTIVAGGTGSILNQSAHDKISGQYGMVTVFVEGNAGTAPQVYLGGDTAV